MMRRPPRSTRAATLFPCPTVLRSGVGAAQRGRLGGAFRLAAGPGLWPRSGERWRDDAPDPPRIGQSFWRAFRGAEECAGTHRSGDEISRRALWPQNGVRGKSEARLWREGADADDAHG